MLSTDNSGKLLSKKYHTDRAKAVENKEHYSSAEQDYLDISGTEGTAKHQSRTYKVKTTPIDSDTPEREKKLDIRLRKEVGGNA